MKDPFDMTNEKYGSLSDGEIVALYFARDEAAVEKTADKYGGLFLKLARGILCEEDAEECVNDVYLKLWNTIPPARPESLMAYGAKAVRNAALSRLEHNAARKRGGDALICELDECSPGLSADPPESEKELSDAIDRFLRGQKNEKRVIFVLRYFHGESISGIAAKTGCGEGKIKTVLHRTRKELKKFLEREGISL